MAVGNVVKILIQLGTLPVMASLLGPSEYGVFALAMPSVSFLILLADGGLGNSLARENEDDVVVWSSAFWALCLSGLVFAVALSIWSVPLAAMAHQPKLPPVMAALSLNIMLVVLAVVPNARLMRRAQTQTYAIVDMVSNILSVAIAIKLAMMGVGVWALVAQTTIFYGLRAIVLNAIARGRLRFTLDLRALTPHLQMGGSIIGAKMSDFVGRILEGALISRNYGPVRIGAYALGSQIAQSGTQSLSNPIWVALYSSIITGKNRSEESAFHIAIRTVAVLLFPAVWVGMALTPQIVHAFLGSKWIEATPIMMCALPSLAISATASLGTAVLYAEGRAQSQMWIAIGYAALRVGVIASVFHHWWSLSIGLAIVNVVYAGVISWNLAAWMGWKQTAMIAQIRGPLVASMLAGATAYLLSVHIGASLLAILLCGVVALFVYLAGMALIDLRLVKADFGRVTGLIKRRIEHAHAD